MKILHIVPSYWPAFERGGPIRSVHLLNKWLVKNGVDVMVYTTNIGLADKAETNQEVLVDGVKVWYFPLTWRGWQYSRELHKKLKKTLKDFDLVHITSTFLSASYLGARYAKKFGVPYIISPRGNLMNEPLKKKSSLKKRIYISLIEKRNLAGASAIHFTTEAERQEYLAQNLPLKKAIVIANPFESEYVGHSYGKHYLRKKFGIKKEEKIVLFLGRLSWKKGFDTLIPGFAGVLKEVPQARLVIVGPDDEGYKKEIQRMIVDNDLEENKDVFFVKEIFGEEKIAAYEDHDLFVLPSYSENFGMSVVEAMDGTPHGTAMVITEGVALGDLIKKENAGKVVPKEESSLTNAMVEILKNPELAKKFEERGHMLVKKYFAPDKIANEFIKAYSDLIK